MCSEHAPDGSRTSVLQAHQGPPLSSPPECHRALLPAFHPHGHTFLPELAPPLEPLPAALGTPPPLWALSFGGPPVSPFLSSQLYL